jgi:hypothetical protein
MVKSRIEACRVAQRFLVPMRFGFEQQECLCSLTRIAEGLSADEHSAFEGHVESGKLSIADALHATQIVDAQFAFPDQIDNALQPRFGGVDFLHCKPGSEAAGVNGKYEYSKQRKIGIVVGAIYEHLATIGDGFS